MSNLTAQQQYELNKYGKVQTSFENTTRECVNCHNAYDRYEYKTLEAKQLAKIYRKVDGEMCPRCLLLKDSISI
jgi:hypothetical protein